MANRESLHGGRYTGFSSLNDFLRENRSSGVFGNTDPWAWTGMSSGDIYGPSFSMYGVGSGSYGSASHQEYVKAVEQAKGPTVYNKWCDCRVPAFEVLAYDGTNQNSEFRESALKSVISFYADKTTEVADPSGLVIDGVSLGFLENNGTVMKMQSGQKLVFHNKEIIKILVKHGSASKAITVGTVLGKTGTVLAGAGIVLTWVQVYTGDKHWAHALMDTTVGIIGIAFPGPGTVVSIFYFAMTSVGDGRGPTSSFTDTGLVPLDNLYVAPTYPKLN